MIQVENVKKSYDGKPAVRGINLNIESGQVFAFLGPNGAGKTTTSKMIVGLLKPSEGRISVCGMNVATEYEEVKKIISYVPDHPYVYDKLTGREFLHFVGRMYDMSPEKTKDKIAHYAEVFETSGYLDNLMESYSSGMKQRVVISAALMHTPRVMIVDEPLVGLDPKSSRLVKDILRDLAEQGVTVFMSTHMISVAEETADRIGIISRGRMVAEGSPAELMSSSNAGLEDIFLKMTEDQTEDTENEK